MTRRVLFAVLLAGQSLAQRPGQDAGADVVPTCPAGSSFVKGGVFAGSQVAGFCATAASLAGAAATLRFEDDQNWKRYASLHIRWSSPSDTGELKATLLAKAEGLTALEKSLRAAVKSPDPGTRICAQLEIAAGHDQLASELTHLPYPPDLPLDLIREMKVQLAQQAAPVQYHAREKFLGVVQASHRTATYNSCTVAAMARLVSMESE